MECGDLRQICLDAGMRGCQLLTKKKAMFKMKQSLKMDGTYLNIIKHMPITSFFRMYHQKIVVDGVFQ